MPTVDLRLRLAFTVSDLDERNVRLIHEHPRLVSPSLHQHFEQNSSIPRASNPRDSGELVLEFETPGGAKLTYIDPTSIRNQPCPLPDVDYQNLSRALIENEAVRCEFSEFLRLLAYIAYNYGPSYREGAQWHRGTPTHFTLMNTGTHAHLIDVHFNGTLHMKDDLTRFIAHRLRGDDASRWLWQLLRTEYEATAAIICGVMKNSPRWIGMQERQPIVDQF